MPLAVSILACLVISAGACKGKPKHQAPPVTVETPTGSGAGSGKAPDIQLPHSDGTLPVKSTKPVDEATFTKFMSMTFPGFQLEGKAKTATALELRQKTEDHPKVWATVTVEVCKDCLPMDIAKWKDHESELKKLVPEILAKQPDTTWELGNTDLDGQTMIYTYQLGQYVGSDGGAFSNAYALYYNDGVNAMRVVAEYKDDPLQTKDAMAKWVPKADLEAVAKAFMDVYTHAW